MTGAIIALAIKEPVALPLAFASHFVLDSLPQYGIEYEDRHKHPSFRRILPLDLVITPLTIVIVSLLAHSWLVFFAMGLAISPDLVWFGKYFYDRRHHRSFSLPKDPFSRFHKWIQWGERSSFWRLEIVYALVLTFIVIKLV